MQWEKALAVNDIGIRLNETFTYDRFPKLNDNQLVEPRAVQQFETGRSTHRFLTLNDESLQKMDL